MAEPLRALRAAATALAFAAALAGCAVTQPKPPEVDLPATPAPTAAQLALLERWWLAFGDPALVSLVDEALASNLDVASAFARVELAREQVLLAQSYLYPYGYLVVGASRSRPAATRIVKERRPSCESSCCSSTFSFPAPGRNRPPTASSCP